MINFELRNHIILALVLISNHQPFTVKSLLCRQGKCTVEPIISSMISDQQLGRTCCELHPPCQSQAEFHSNPVTLVLVPGDCEDYSDNVGGFVTVFVTLLPHLCFAIVSQIE